MTLHFINIVYFTLNIFRTEDRVPVALSVHHTPISLTYAFLRTGRESDGSGGGGGHSMTSDCSVVADPTEREEMVSEGTLTVIMNGHGE